MLEIACPLGGREGLPCGDPLHRLWRSFENNGVLRQSLQIHMGLNSVIVLTLHSALFFSHKKEPVPKGRVLSIGR